MVKGSKRDVENASVLEASALVDPVPFGTHQLAKRIERRFIVVEHQHIFTHIHQLKNYIQNRSNDND